MNHSSPWCTALLVALFVAAPWGRATAQPAGSIRTARGLARDLRRAQRTPLPDDWAYIGLPERPVSWTAQGAGRRQFTVALDRGWSLVGRTRPDASSGATEPGERLVSLELRRGTGSRRHSLLPAGSWPIGLSTTASAARSDRTLRWKQPRTNLDLFALMHEQGHATDVSGSWGQRYGDEIFTAARLVDQRKPITERQKRLFISTERRAWAHALLRIRALRQRGIDPFPGIPQKTLLDYAHSDLKTHLLKAMACPSASN